jgi:hypothetical protein
MSNVPSAPNPGEQPSEPPVTRFAHNPTSARVPEKIARGVTATDFMAFFGPNEFVIDFLQLLSRPPTLVARVALSPNVAEQFVGVLRENLMRYQQQFGAPPAMPRGKPPEKPRPPQEIYDDVKIPEDVVSGVYANSVMVGHSPAEFGIDFITAFIPHAAVSARIYVAAPRVPQLIETLSGLVTQYKKQHGIPVQQIQGLPENPPPPPQEPPGYGTAPGIPGFPTPPQS